MALNLGALDTTGSSNITEIPDSLGAVTKGVKGALDIQGMLDQQQERAAKKKTIASLPALMQRVKESENDYDAISQLAQHAPGVFGVMQEADKFPAEIAAKRKAELTDNLASGYAFISSAEQRGQSKEQAWDDFVKWNQSHGLDLGELANEPYSDMAMSRLKTLALGAKALAGGGERFGSVVWKKDAQGNLIPMQLTKDGEPMPLAAGTGESYVEPVKTIDTGGGTIVLGEKSGKVLKTIEKTLTPGQAADVDPETQARLAAAKERAKVEAEAEGKRAAALTGKGVDAQSTLSLLDEAEKLIPVATGSYLGAGRDIAGAVVGETTKGAEALASLKIIGNKLVQFVPRMEGPQSDKDVASYKEAAGDFANPTTTSGQKMAALRTMRALNQKYAAQNQSQPAEVRGAPKKINSKAQYDALPSGAAYIAPDGSQRRKK